MAFRSDTMLMQETPGIMSNNGSKSKAKSRTTVTTYPTASQSTFNLDRDNSNVNNAIELETAEESDEPIEQGWISTSREWSMVVCFAIMAMMVAMDALILIPILPKITGKYHSNPSRDTMWPMTVYILANATFQRFHVAVMEIFGRRNMLIAGLIVFTMGLILISASPPLFPILLVGRAVQGAGAAAMVSIPPAMLMDMIPERRRSMYNFAIILSSAIGAILGLTLGGIFIRQDSWKWIFYIAAPFCFLLFVITPLAVRPVGESLEPKKRLMKVDWTGSFLFSGSMTSLLLGLTWATSLNKELKLKVLVALGAGAVGMIVTMLYERSGASRPLLSLGILRVSPLTFLCVLIQSLLIAVQLVCLPAYLGGVHDSSSTTTGAILIPMIVTMLLVTGGIDIVPTKLYRYRWPLWFGWALNIASSASLTTFNTHTTLRVCIIVMLVTGLGHGITISATHTALRELSRQRSRSQRDACLIANFVRTAGFCLAIASADSAFRTRLRIHDEHYSPAQVYSSSFEDLMRALTILAGFGGLLSLFVGWKRTREGGLHA
ncbi:puromycin resistance protein pur8, putative [Talaromyces marneffei ATCC 18224]|uniref:Puromycin resistance protein pur8, putative n=1 Tax=Talaromyces marneffei (strain ATCC 18224 / CBS 334.59 / QM 7333) TaxID=441960 RepID=B6QUG8_TALMQ|nr:puromycin resistance protein pur8, putative [Talaromyces marneffei ATCC 18224]